MKLKVNRSDGSTLELDLLEGEWDARKADPAFQASITGLVLVGEAGMHALNVPRGFRTVSFAAEVVRKKSKAGQVGEATGARIGWQADDVQGWLTVYYNDVVRMSVQRVGRPRFVPADEPWPQRREAR